MPGIFRMSGVTCLFSQWLLSFLTTSKPALPQQLLSGPWSNCSQVPGLFACLQSTKTKPGNSDCACPAFGSQTQCFPGPPKASLPALVANLCPVGPHFVLPHLPSNGAAVPVSSCVCQAPGATAQRLQAGMGARVEALPEVCGFTGTALSAPLSPEIKSQAPEQRGRGFPVCQAP